MSFRCLTVLAIVLCHCSSVMAQLPEDGQFRWKVSEPILTINPEKLPATEHAWIAVKDPSIVRFENRWHLFCTLRKNKTGDGRIRIGYVSFEDFSKAKDATWSVLDLTLSYHGAPQIFWFEPHQTWYLIYQAADKTRGLKYGPCYSTNDDLTKPEKWTRPRSLYIVPKGQKAGLDFWVICDDKTAHLFFTTNNGQMWRAETPLASFPDRDWSQPEVALKADIFEASHTYRLSKSKKFLTVIEAQGKGRRSMKAYIADTLNGEWKPLAGSLEKPFAAPKTVINPSWATSYSHGELIRKGFNQRLEIDENNLQLLFQGVNDKEYRNRSYGQIPWKLGLLTQSPE